MLKVHIPSVVVVNEKKRYGRIEKKIIEILKSYDYVEYSLRLMAEEISKDNNTNSPGYNTVRNAVDRLEKYKIIETKTVPVYDGCYISESERDISKLRMIRLYVKSKPWECEGGIHVQHNKQLISKQSNCKV